MPARVVVVHDDPAFLFEAASGLRLAGYEVAEFEDSMAALHALLGAESIEVLVTRIKFAPGKPHGVSLAQMTISRRPKLKVIFTALAEFEPDTHGIGEFMPLPVSVPTLVHAVNRLCQRVPVGKK